MKVVLLGYYGFGNLGDELLLQSCIELLTRSGLGREEIVVLSNAPEDTSRTFGVHAVNRWSLREVVSVLRRSYVLVLGGGGLFQDATSLKSCVWYWGVVRLAGMLGCTVWALGQSVGPLKSGVSRVLAGDALRLCRKVHVRDRASLGVVEALGCRAVLGEDLVMMLRAEARASSGDCMLVNLRPCRDLDTYTKIIAPYVDAKAIGVALADEDVKALAPLGLFRVVKVRTLDEAMGLWAEASEAVGMRLHFGVLSRMFRIPLALMPYDVKVSEFAEQSGVPCIVTEWKEPVMPREVPDCSSDVEEICREIISL